MSPSSDPTMLCPVRLPRDAMDADLRQFRRTTLFRLDDAVRDARAGRPAIVRLAKKHLPLTTLALYESQHQDVEIQVAESPAGYVVSVVLHHAECLAETH